MEESEMGHDRYLSPDRALQSVLEALKPLDPVVLPAHEAIGMVLAEAVVSNGDHPPFDRSMMDGFAVRLEDAGHEVPVADEVAAGQARVEPLPIGSAVEIMTGAMCPEGTEAVVPVEVAERLDGRVRLPVDLALRQHIAARGSECRAGTTVLEAGAVITPLRLALLHSVGRTSISVLAPPRMAIITTGDELVPPDEEPGPGQIRASNGSMLAAMALGAGVREVTQLSSRDDLAEMVAALSRAEGNDVIVLTGGVSTGRYDLVPDAVAEWGGDTIWHGVSQKPGKPMLFAARGNTPVFGLPGNPLSAHLGFHRYVRAACRALMGLDPSPLGAAGRLAEGVRVGGSRTNFRLCSVVSGGSGWHVSTVLGRGSADVFAAATANAIVRLEPREEPYLEGEEVLFEWLGQPARTDVPALTDVLAPIAARRSLRTFEAGPVPSTVLRRMFEAARWAPSSGNGQPWRFVITDKDDPTYELLTNTLKPRNDWARSAPHLVLVAAKRMYDDHPTKPSKHNRLALLETGLALGNLMIQGANDEVVAHALDGFDAEAAGAAVGVPEGFDVTVMLAVGRAPSASVDDVPVEGEPTPRRRRSLSNLVFRGVWGAAAEGW